MTLLAKKAHPKGSMPFDQDSQGISGIAKTGSLMNVQYIRNWTDIRKRIHYGSMGCHANNDHYLGIETRKDPKWRGIFQFCTQGAIQKPFGFQQVCIVL